MSKQWWKEIVAYQVYPRSFYDSNGDGIGDLPGLIEKLDYLKELGIDLIWVCPIFDSPNDDNGYDIRDYKAILDEFGTMEDCDRLIEEVHKRDMKIIFDLVVNHTSDEHEWFIESRSSKDNPYRDYYIWHEGDEEGNRPNNWESIFSGSVWEYDEQTEEYYMHVFSKKQPDLNWENPAVRQDVYSLINWWLDKGIDGFRVDAISHIKKREGFPDMPNPLNKDVVPSYDGDDSTLRKTSAKALGMMYFFMQGTPFIYQGQEIGMTNVQFDELTDYDDIQSVNRARQMMEEGTPREEAMNYIYASSRDNVRTPMQWNSQPEAGFTTGTPWLGVNPNYADINVAESLKDPNSIYHFYKEMIALRRDNEALIYGSYELVLPLHKQVYAYKRRGNSETYLVVVNVFNDSAEVDLTPFDLKELVLTNYEVPNSLEKDIQLRPYEARLYRLA